ncbi:hypothetical protein L7F22_001329 [Adiantum nelumboides]|nr:hypothetical protein [Adiantum nelumboides]
MASCHLSHASTHKPSIATTCIIIIISVSLVPYFALCSSELIPSTIPNIAYTLWDSLCGLATSSPFYFFLLNFLIVALVCSSGALDPSSMGQDFAELQDQDPLQSGLYSAAHIMQDRLALEEIYGSHKPFPSSLRLIKRSNVYVVNEEHCEDGLTNFATSTLLQNPAFTDMDASDGKKGSLPQAHSPSGPRDIKLDAIEGSMTRDTLALSPVTSLDVIATGHSQDATSFHMNRTIDAKVAQVCTEEHHEDHRYVKPAGDGVDHGKGDDAAHRRDGAVENDAQFRVDVANNIDVNGKHNDYGDDDAFHRFDASPLQAPIAQITAESHPVMAHRADVGEGNVSEVQENANDVSADAREPSEEKTGEGQLREGEMAMAVEREEEEMMMSREELNERVSAFISAFRRKLSSTAMVDA